MELFLKENKIKSRVSRKLKGDYEKSGSNNIKKCLLFDGIEEIVFGRNLS